MDARPVGALGDDPAVAVAAVPEVGDGRSSLRPAACQLADDVAVRVDDLETDAVGAPKPERIVA